LSARLVALAVLLWAGGGAAAPPFCASTPEPGARPDFAPLVKVGTPEAPQAPGAWTWVNLWATWCEPCVDELPRLLRFQAALGGPSVVRVVLISVDETAEAVRKHLAEAKLAGAWHAPAGAARTTVSRSLGLDGGVLPTQVLIDPQGKVVCVHEGMVDEIHLPAARALLKPTPGG
jgi:thiol-disulfide isomerase/thioredoxin